jgi:hypothetical protein
MTLERERRLWLVCLLYTQALEHFGFWRTKHHPRSQSVQASEVAEFLNSHLSRCDYPPPAARKVQTCQSALNRFMTMLGFRKSSPQILQGDKEGHHGPLTCVWKETAQHIRAWLKLAGLRADQPLLPNSLRKADDSNRRSATASITHPDRSGELPVTASSPHFPSYYSPRDNHEFASIRGRRSHHRTLVRSRRSGYYPPVRRSRSPHEGTGLATSATTERKARSIQPEGGFTNLYR